MALKYCVFWYPTIFHTKLSPICRCPKDGNGEIDRTCKCNIREADASDNIGYGHHVTITLDECTKNLRVNSYSIEGNRQIEVELKYISSSRNGFILYSYEIDLLSEHAKAFESILSECICYLAKDFYHTHKLKSEGDVLRACIFDKPIHITGENNPALIHFLKLYEEKFIAYIETLSEGYSYLEEKSSQQDCRYSTNITKRLIFDSFCENALTEYIDCKTLLGLRYNESIETSTHKNSSYNQRNTHKEEDLHTIAFNIEIAVHYIKFIKEKNLNTYRNFIANYTRALVEKQMALSEKTNSTLQQATHSIDAIDEATKRINKSGKRSITLGWIGFAAGAICILLAIISFIMTPDIKPIGEKQDQATKEIQLLREEIKTLQSTISTQKQAIPSIQKRNTK